jgi:hypothetical protein
MATTPEGKVKAKVNKLLSQYPVYRYMPVPGGFGVQTLDYLICHNGRFAAIETKAPGKQPTAIQHNVIREMRAAGAEVFVIDGEDSVGFKRLSAWLEAYNPPYEE